MTAGGTGFLPLIAPFGKAAKAEIVLARGLHHPIKTYLVHGASTQGRLDYFSTSQPYRDRPIAELHAHCALQTLVEDGGSGLIAVFAICLRSCVMTHIQEFLWMSLSAFLL